MRNSFCSGSLVTGGWDGGSMQLFRMMKSVTRAFARIWICGALLDLRCLHRGTLVCSDTVMGPRWRLVVVVVAWTMGEDKS